MSIPAIEDYRVLSAEALAEIKDGRAGRARRNKCERDVVTKYKNAGN